MNKERREGDDNDEEVSGVPSSYRIYRSCKYENDRGRLLVERRLTGRNKITFRGGRAPFSRVYIVAWVSNFRGLSVGESS